MRLDFELSSSQREADLKREMRIPKRLARNPIIDAVAELRFSTSIPEDAVIGLVYSALHEVFGKPEGLPILQIPSALVDKEPTLRYQARYKFTRPGNVLQVGPRNIALSTYPYVDWDSALPLLSDVLTRLTNTHVLERVERLGLRYINLFENLNICDHSTLSLAIRGSSIGAQSITLKTETASEGFKLITQVSNTAKAQIAGEWKQGSILDIDVIKEDLEIAGDTLVARVLAEFALANKVADVTFFSLLKDDFIQTFEPRY